ncbi:MAG TPA: RDD family protein [Flavobacteriales bacterium]|nr:RDD family protein [Flavobacteriales bacterium]
MIIDQTEKNEEPIAEIDPDKHPSLVVRYQAVFADVLVIICLMFLSGYILEQFDNPPDWIRIVLFFAIWGVYEPVCISLGGTIGNLIMKTRVRKHNNEGQKPGIGQAIIRYVLKLLLGWISFLTMSSNDERRAIHDLVSGTVVVNSSYLKKKV